MYRVRFVALRLYNSLLEYSWNSVSCITPFGMVQETLFLRPDPKERASCANECRQATVITLLHILGLSHFVCTLHFLHISVWLSNVWSVYTTLKIIYTPVYTTTCTITRHSRLITLCTSRFYHAATNKNDYGRPYYLLLQMKRLPRTTVTTNCLHRQL